MSIKTFELSKALIFFSMDLPTGTGDHENYLEDSKDAYQIGTDKLHCSSCEKKAVMVRSKRTHIPWYALTPYKLVFSKPIPNYYYMDINYTKVLLPKYG